MPKREYLSALAVWGLMPALTDTIAAAGCERRNAISRPHLSHNHIRIAVAIQRQHGAAAHLSASAERRYRRRMVCNTRRPSIEVLTDRSG
jgi:hypothetical protein